MRAVLINPPPATEFDKHWARFPVLGLAYLAASLRDLPCEVFLLDGKLENLSAAELVAKTLELEPDFVGITCMTVEFPMLVSIAEAIKAASNARIIVGGAHINAVQAQAMHECEAIDFACVGEGEHLIREFATALRSGSDPSAIRGLISRRRDPDGGSRVVLAGPRPYPKDYDALAFPAWDLFKLGNQIPILTHRGCPFHCTFCGHNSGFKTRFRTPENVIEEIERDIHAGGVAVDDRRAEIDGHIGDRLGRARHHAKDEDQERDAPESRRGACHRMHGYPFPYPATRPTPFTITCAGRGVSSPPPTAILPARWLTIRESPAAHKHQM